MTQEEKSILLKDLCARLPYGVKVQPSSSTSPHKFVGYDKSLVRIDTDQRFELENIKPYLRPMLSMTSDEFEEFINIVEHICIGKLQINIANPEAFDWLNAHHFDYRGLIEKRLALEAKEEMY